MSLHDALTLPEWRFERVPLDRPPYDVADDEKHPMGQLNGFYVRGPTPRAGRIKLGPPPTGYRWRLDTRRAPWSTPRKAKKDAKDAVAAADAWLGGEP